jgi:hypothetical protein
MAVLVHVLLRVLHSFHFLIALLSASWHRLNRAPPLPLQVTRRRIPRHLALLLVSDSIHDPAATRESFLESASRAVGWCRTAGIEKLTLYDSEGASGPIVLVFPGAETSHCNQVYLWTARTKYHNGHLSLASWMATNHPPGPTLNIH